MEFALHKLSEHQNIILINDYHYTIKQFYQRMHSIGVRHTIRR